MFLKLATKSLINRKGSVTLTLMAMTVSVFVLFAVEHIRHETKHSFASTVSGVDLIAGARSGSLNLLLYSVFRIGAATNNVSWRAFEEISSHPQVEWTIPIVLGDSHRGFRVVGTNHNYFQHFSYGDQRKIQFAEGNTFNTALEVVIGSEVAKKLDYKLGQTLTLAHGLSDTSFTRHEQFPFSVVGILAPTGTPIDQTLHISLAGIEAIHLSIPRHIKPTPEQIEKLELKPKSVTAIMIGLKSRIATFAVQRAINEDSREPLQAILPGVALSELWQLMSILESTLFFVSVFVFIAALLGLSAMLLSSIRSRTNEIRLLRAIGAHPRFLFLLIELEALLITILSLVVGSALLTLGLTLAEDFIIAQFGLHINQNIFSQSACIFALSIIAAAAFVAAIPSFSAYILAKHSE